jgi:hypothetical protein
MKVRVRAAGRFLALFTPVILFAAADAWIPARWTGGPLELERPGNVTAVLKDAALREAIAGWYDPATLDLLRESPVNCLLVTWSAGAPDAIELRQHQILQPYAAAARRRGIAMLGLIYPGADPAKFVPEAAAAHLDGLALEGEFPSGFLERVQRAMAAASPSAVVFAIAKNPAPLRASAPPVLAVEGESASARNLATMGIRAAPSSEPWIQSNIWLVRSFRPSEVWRPVWIGYEPDRATKENYARAVADAAVAGGRWIVALDDNLRVGLRRGDAGALDTWKEIGKCIRFSEEHAEWRRFAPYGNLGVIIDRTNPGEMTDEYLKLLMRRQVPYRLIDRSQLGAGALAGFRAVLATELVSPTPAEQSVLALFAEGGGLVVAGPAWGEASQTERSVEKAAGKGRLAVYKEPDPEVMAREMRELLPLRDVGVIPFNVPSVITYVSREVRGGRLLIQLLNYSDSPATDITIRVSGTFRSARMFAPGTGVVELPTTTGDGRTEIQIPKLLLWGGVVLEGDSP